MDEDEIPELVETITQNERDLAFDTSDEELAKVPITIVTGKQLISLFGFHKAMNLT